MGPTDKRDSSRDRGVIMSNNVYDSEFIREVQNMLRIIGRSTGENELIIPENGILDSITS